MIKKSISIVGDFISLLVFLFEIIVIIVVFMAKLNGSVPSIFGYNLFYIATPSMEPYLKVGDVIISKEYQIGQELEVGDVITYNGKVDSYQGKKITHEIIEIGSDAEGMLITCKGMANNVADPIISDKDVLGVMVYKPIILSLIYRAISTLPGFIIMFIIPTLYILILEIKNINSLVKSGDDDYDDEKEKNS